MHALAAGIPLNGISAVRKEQHMAIGAVLFSFPTAVLGTLVVAFLQGLSTEQSLALYSTTGFLTMLTFLVINGIFSDDKG